MNVLSVMEDEEYLTVPEVARYMRVHSAMVRKWIRTDVLVAETIQEGKRKRYRIKKSYLLANYPTSPAQKLRTHVDSEKAKSAVLKRIFERSRRLISTSVKLAETAPQAS